MSAYTIYRVEGSRGVVDYLDDADRAEALSRAGYTVTALTESEP